MPTPTRSQLEINPVSGEDVEKLVKEVYATPADSSPKPKPRRRRTRLAPQRRTTAGIQFTARRDSRVCGVSPS